MNTKAWARAYNHLLLQLTKKKVIRNYNRYCTKKRGHALLYYKTDAFSSGYIHDYSHTNYWEVTETARILNHAGFWVDILDRSADVHSFEIQDKYKIVIGSASTHQASGYAKIVNKTPSAIKIFYATTAAPKLHNAQLTQRHAHFESRTRKRLPIQRQINEKAVSQAIHASDAIFSLGSTWANASYAEYNKPIYRIRVSTAPFLQTNMQEMSTKDPRQFLFLAGSGNILKGLDITLEAFAELPRATLHVCTPLEPSFLEIYHPLLRTNPNIRLHGFIPLRGSLFRRISTVSRFAVLPSATEAVATAAATCIRRGTIPLMTNAVDLDQAESYAYLLSPHPSPTELAGVIEQAIADTPTELLRRSEKSYAISQRYTQSSFSKTFSEALYATLA